MTGKQPPPPPATQERIERTERFDTFVRFLDSKGGEWQRRWELFAADVGIGEYSLRTAVDRAQDLGILKVIASTHPIIGVGRFPNTYRLLITYDQWLERRDDLIAVLLAKNAAERKRRASARAAKRRELKEARKVPKRQPPKRKAVLAEPPPPLPDAPVAAVDAILDDEWFDADAWADDEF